MTVPLFRSAPYLTEAQGRVVAITEKGGIILDQSLFYAQSGGQPGDTGDLVWPGGQTAIANTLKGPEGAIVLLPEPGYVSPPVGAEVVQRIDWDRRYRHMRVHTALHLLSVAVPFPVTGGQIGADKGRLDFDIPEAPGDVRTVEERINDFIRRDLPVTESWITDEELQASPQLVKTLSVAPPMGQGRVRLIGIGLGEDRIDLQPCGGTHVARTGEIGAISIGKIENKGRQNRRITVLLGH